MILLKTSTTILFFLFSFCSFGLFTHWVLERNLLSQGSTPLFYKSASFTILGAGLLAAIWQTFALFGHLTASTIVIVCSVSITFGICQIWVHSKLITFTFSSSFWPAMAAPWAWRIFCLATLVLVLFGALEVNRSIAGDGEVQNFAVAKVVGESGSLSHSTLPGPYEFRLYLGLLGEMHQAALIAVGSYEAAKIMDWPLTVISAILIAGICSRVGLNRRAQWMAVFIFYSGHGLISLMSSGKVDIFATSLAVGALFWSVETSEVKSQTPVFFAFLLAGLAIVAKLSYGITLLVCVTGSIAWFRYQDLVTAPIQRLRKVFLICASAAGGFVIGVIPLFLKNYVIFNDPLATFLSPITSPILAMKLFDNETASHVIRAWPLSVALMPSNDNLSILLPASLPLILLLPRPRSFSSSRLAAITCLGLLAQIIWICAKPNVPAWRYIYPCFVLFFPIAAAAIEHTLFSPGAKRLKAALVLTICLLIELQIETYEEFGASWSETVRYFSRPDSTYCDWAGANCSALKEINSQAVSGERVFVAADSRFYLRADLIQSSSTTSESGLALTSTRFDLGQLSPARRWKSLLDMGFRYILIEHRSPYFDVFESLKIGELPKGVSVKKLYGDGTLEAYRIN